MKRGAVYCCDQKAGELIEDGREYVFRYAPGVLPGGVAWCMFFMKLHCGRELSYYGLDRQALFDIFYSRFCAIREWGRALLGG